MKITVIDSNTGELIAESVAILNDEEFAAVLKVLCKPSMFGNWHYKIELEWI